VIDFTVPESTLALADACVDAGVGMVVGTTGFDSGGMASLRSASQDVPVLKATNFSRGIQVYLRTIGEAVSALPTTTWN